MVLVEYNKMRKFVLDHPIISLCLFVNSGMRKFVVDQQKQKRSSGCVLFVAVAWWHEGATSG
jgi:hypothetical protein